MDGNIGFCTASKQEFVLHSSRRMSSFAFAQGSPSSEHRTFKGGAARMRGCWAVGAPRRRSSGLPPRKRMSQYELLCQPEPRAARELKPFLDRAEPKRRHEDRIGQRDSADAHATDLCHHRKEKDTGGKK